MVPQEAQEAQVVQIQHYQAAQVEEERAAEAVGGVDTGGAGGESSRGADATQPLETFVTVELGTGAVQVLEESMTEHEKALVYIQGFASRGVRHEFKARNTVTGQVTIYRAGETDVELSFKGIFCGVTKARRPQPAQRTPKRYGLGFNLMTIHEEGESLPKEELRLQRVSDNEEAGEEVWGDAAGQEEQEKQGRPQSFEVEEQAPHPSYWSVEQSPDIKAAGKMVVALKAYCRSSEADQEAVQTMQCFVKCLDAHGTGLRYTEEVRLVVSGRDIFPAKVMMDDGANVDLMDNTFRVKHGIRLFDIPTKLSTATNTEGQTLGMTEIVGIQYGTGADAIRVARPFLVAEGMSGLYDVLLGNQDTKAFRATICEASSTYAMRRGGQKDLVLTTVSRST